MVICIEEIGRCSRSLLRFLDLAVGFLEFFLQERAEDVALESAQVVVAPLFVLQMVLDFLFNLRKSHINRCLRIGHHCELTHEPSVVYVGV